MKLSFRYLAAVIITAATYHHYANADDLLSSYQQALQNDPVTLKAQAQYMVTKEAIEQTRAILLPQINAFGNISQSEAESYDTTVNMSRNVISSELERTGLGANLNMQIYHHSSWAHKAGWLHRGTRLAHPISMWMQSILFRRRPRMRSV